LSCKSSYAEMQHVSPPSSQSSAYECRFPWFKRLDDSKGFCTLCAKYFTQHPTRVVHPFTSPEGTVFLNEDELCQHDRSRVHAKAERDGKPLAIPEVGETEHCILLTAHTHLMQMALVVHPYIHLQVQDDDFPKFSEQHTFKTEKG
jgi:hypothetical protein